MIEVVEYKKNRAVQGDLKRMLSPKIFSWVDVFEPTKAELQKISSITKIPMEDLDIILDEEERAKIVEIEGPFSLLIFGAPDFEKDEITTAPIFIYVSKKKNCVMTIRLKETRSISKIKEKIGRTKNLFNKGVSHFVYKVVEQILGTFFFVLEDIENRVDKIEDEVVKSPSMDIVERIFETKKTLIYFMKAIAANREVISSVERGNVTDIDRKIAKEFVTMHNDTDQLVDMSSTFRDLLTGTLDTYLSSASMNLNQVMKTLTVGASFILVPTLIASIYGMNFQGMPELYWKYGYLFALSLMVLSVLGMYLFFKKKKWI
ncbi:MAG: magnesium/cobalt transporter CorA [Nanoarchaeota archaeon]|nr:magnesium/cobalt transporter CorA [Nanoarchaeota archaeon]